MIHVSAVIPAYNEGARLPALVRQLAELGARTGSPAVEIIVVDDGSQPSNADLERDAVAEAAAHLEKVGAPHRFRFLAAEKNGGKGAAIRLGWSQSVSDAAWLGFVDADGAVSAEEFWRLVRMLETDPPLDVLAGSRVKMASRKIHRSLVRHLQGRVFATFVEQAFGLGFYDTQCGLKFARASLLRPLLGYLKEDRWLFDVELLAALRPQNARFVEEPIDWSDPGDSKVRPGIDAARMFVGLARIRMRLDQLPQGRPASGP